MYRDYKIATCNIGIPPGVEYDEKIKDQLRVLRDNVFSSDSGEHTLRRKFANTIKKIKN